MLLLSPMLCCNALKVPRGPPSLAFPPPGQGMGVTILCSHKMAQNLAHTQFLEDVWNELLN